MYEPLEQPDEYPTCIPSPSNVINWKKGDCFDLSMLLCSLLIGVGYDAYCVIGTAPHEITLKNEALMSNPDGKLGLDEFPEESANNAAAKEHDEYAGDKKDKPESQFDKKLCDEAIVIQRQKEFEENNILDDDEPDRLPDDPFVGKRIHCWCLIKKGPRKVKEDVFIEPSTGRIWGVQDGSSPYLRIDQVFNHKNFWIN